MEIAAIVLPVILMLVLGTFLKSKGMIDSQCVSGIKNIISNIMLPAVLFNAISTAEFTGSDIKLVAGVYGVFTVILALGFLMRPVFGTYGRFAPFLCVSCETGMLGYPLYMTLYGQEGLSTIVRVDLANILFAFTVFLFVIKAVANGNVDKKRMVTDSLRSPIIIAVIMGLAMSVTGMGRMLTASPIFPVYNSVVEMVTGPLTALVLITVGYDLDLDKSVMVSVAKVSLARLLLNGCGLAVIFFLFRSFWSDRGLLAAVVLMFCLPGQFITPIYVSEEGQRKFVSTQISLYTLISILAYVMMAVFWRIG